MKTDAEVTPPLSFVLSWAASQLGSGPDLIRLPSLVAGTATIPLVYLVGARTAGRAAGLIASAIVALSPFMIYYAVEARGYALMMAFVVGSTLSMLIALDRGGRGWWGLYGLCSALAMYSHYTAAFPLIAQLAWLLWAHRELWRAALAANLLAFLLYIPWIPGYMADQSSVTIPYVNAFLPFTFHAVRLAIENWAVGYPYVALRALPGEIWAALIALGALAAFVFAGLRALESPRLRGASLGDVLRTRVALLFALALAAPIGEAIYSAVGTNVLGARNMNSSLPGLALSIGTVIAAAPLAVGIGAGALVFAGLGVGAVKTTQARYARADNPDIARFIEARWSPGDVVADASVQPVVPLTGLDTYLPQTHREIRFRQPEGDPPYTLFNPVPKTGEQAAQAARLPPGARLFFVVTGSDTTNLGVATSIQQYNAGVRRALMQRLPSGYRVLDSYSVAGVQPLVVYEIGPRG